MTSITNTMTINIVNNGDDNLANPILERAFLKVGDKVEEGATFSQMAQNPEEEIIGLMVHEWPKIQIQMAQYPEEETMNGT